MVEFTEINENSYEHYHTKRHGIQMQVSELFSIHYLRFAVVTGATCL